MPFLGRDGWELTGPQGCGVQGALGGCSSIVFGGRLGEQRGSDSGKLGGTEEGRGQLFWTSLAFSFHGPGLGTVG